MGTGVSPSTRIVTRIAAAEGVEPTALEPPLYDVVDPDALDRLVESSADGPIDADATITFTYHSYRVNVDGAGTVDVRPSNGSTDSSPDAEPTEDVHGD